MHVRVASLLRDVLAEVENALLDWATDPGHEAPGPVFDRLNDFSAAITRSVMQADVVTREDESLASSGREDRGGMRLEGLKPIVEAGGALEERAAARSRIVERGRPLDKVLFQEIGTTLALAIEAAGISRLVVLLDEWTAVPLDLQPLLADFLKRAFL